ncbi:MAG: hypothetical protein NVSMB3_05560 [Acidobacteriaceae bacterium]
MLRGVVLLHAVDKHHRLAGRPKTAGNGGERLEALRLGLEVQPILLRNLLGL